MQTKDTHPLMAISPLDGRYYEKMGPLRTIFSEYGLIRFRVMVEIRWLETLASDLTESSWLKKLTGGNQSDIPPLSAAAKKTLNDIIDNFSEQDALFIKVIESKINHDVKAVEYFIKERIKDQPDLSALSEFIHFGCTSEDINNLAYGLMLETARKECILPAINEVITLLKKMAHEHADLAMLARTHGQPATPTTVGKELANVVARLNRQVEQLNHVPILGKMNGATGNYSALLAAYPNIDWQTVCKNFVTKLGLTFNPYTTQIEPHDALAEFFAVMIRIDTILIDFNRDTWGYIAINYFKQKSVAHEVGSSTMPHKVNPIDFENAEGNLGIANALYEHMIAKLPISRWQRDLSDSTVLRNMGVAFGHSILAFQSTWKGLMKLEPNHDVLQHDLNQHWEVLAEPIQTIMRRFKMDEPYEKLKAFTRGKPIDQVTLHAFIQDLDLPSDIKQQLLNMTPADYTGIAGTLAKNI